MTAEKNKYHRSNPLQNNGASFSPGKPFADPTGGNRKNGKYRVGLIAALAAFLVYLPSLGNGFLNWDDGEYVYDNPFIRSFDTGLLKWAFTSFNIHNWHPLTWISHALDVAIWGLNPLGHHLTNNIIHAANTFLVVLLAIEFLNAYVIRRRSPHWDERTVLAAGLATGLLFGLHPLRVESVAWISERKDLLCAFFFLLGILAYLRYVDLLRESVSALRMASRRRSYLLALVVFLLALLSKPMAVTFPVVLLLIDWYPLDRLTAKTWKRVALEKAPFIALSLAASMLTVKAQIASKALHSLEIIPFIPRIYIGIKALAVYLWKTVFPFSLVPFYPYPTQVDFLSLNYFGPVLFVVAASGLFVKFAKKNRLWLAAWGYYIITISPTLGFVQVGGQAMADRYTYLPSISILFVAGLGAAWVYERSGTFKVPVKALCVAISVFLLFSMSYLTVKQTGKWKDNFVFWHYIIENEPGLALPHNNLALAYAGEGLIDRAIEHLHRAMVLSPRWVAPYYNLANIYRDMGMVDSAISEFQFVLTLDPRLAVAHNNLGILYASKGLIEEAIRHFRIASGLDPANEAFRANLNRAMREAER